jgi:hypothetical protein
MQSSIEVFSGAPVFNYKLKKVGKVPNGENILYTMDQIY